VSDDIDVLGGMLSPAGNSDGANVPAYFDTGIVTALVDANHVRVNLGDKQVLCYVPQTGAIAPAVASAVQVCVQENTYFLAAILSGGTAVPPVEITNATSLYTPDTLVKRDAFGRAQFIQPSGQYDAAPKVYVDEMIGSRPFGHMGRTDGFALNINAVVGMSAAQKLRGGMTFNSGTYALVVPATGLYMLNHRAYWTGGTGYAGTSKLLKNGGTEIVGSYLAQWKQDGADYTWNNSVCVDLTAGDTVSIFMSSAGSAGSTWGTTGYNGTFLEVLALF
jgi:hypothetical protein